MKRFLRSILAAGAALLITGCAEPYYQKIEELQERVETLQDLCDKINQDLVALQTLVKAIESKDMITGVTEMKSGSVVTGYRINFVQHESITITNGQDGGYPLVSSRQNPEDNNYYWAVRYGDGDWEWLRSSDGSMMLSIGLLPFITIRSGYFYLTFDGVDWTQLGKADGIDGDQMFSAIDVSNPDYVTIKLADGQVLRIPTYTRYLSLLQEVKAINESADAQTELLSGRLDSLRYIRRIEPIVSDGDTIGQNILFSDGRSFNIYDWSVSMSPSIFVKQDTDGKLYWAYNIGKSPVQWVLSSEGEKIPATSEEVPVPIVSIAQGDDGQFYWTVTTGDSTEFLRFRVDDEWTPRAIDSMSRAFHAVRNYNDSLVVVLRDTTIRFSLPKQYTVKLTDKTGATVGETIQMRQKAGGDEAVINYLAYGVNASLTLLVQGGFTVTDVPSGPGSGSIRIKAPAAFESRAGRVVAIFTFPGATPVTVVKTITIVK